MPTRRTTLVGMFALVFGSAAATAGAFTSGVESTSDMRVVVESELGLVPVRNDGDGGKYVEVDDGGEIESFVLQHLNKRAITDFAELARIVNNGDLAFDRFEMEFSAEDGDGDAVPSVADTLKIVGDAVDDSTDGVYTLLSGSETLEPGDGVTFGLGVNLMPEQAPGSISDLPEGTLDVTLHIDAIRD